MNTEWITDRLPTAEDGHDGWVFVTEGDHVRTRHYNLVLQGQPWQPMTIPTPYVKSKRWTLRWNILGGCWVLENNRNEWVVIEYITEDQVEFAQQIEDIYNKALP
jgi:hypothetical protein